jgi:hypothetical protein
LGFQANLMGPASAIAVIIVLLGLALALLLPSVGRRDTQPANSKALDMTTRAQWKPAGGTRGLKSGSSTVWRLARLNWIGGGCGVDLGSSS